MVRMIDRVEVVLTTFIQFAPRGEPQVDENNFFGGPPLKFLSYNLNATFGDLNARAMGKKDFLICIGEENRCTAFES